MADRLSTLAEWLKEVSKKNIEVFLVHDFQDETTGSELRSLVMELNSQNIFLSEGRYGSAGIARNSVLSQCNGQWIAFWDSDDMPNLLNSINSIDDEFDVIVGEFIAKKPNGESKHYSHANSYQSSMTRLSFQPGIWRILFRREIISEIRFPEFKMGEDQDFLAQIRWQEVRVKFSPKIFYTYNIGQDYQTTARGKSRVSLIDSIGFLGNLLESHIGTEFFIRNLATRQFITIFRDVKITLKIKAIRKFWPFIRGSKSLYRQLFSAMSLLNYLFRTS